MFWKNLTFLWQNFVNKCILSKVANPRVHFEWKFNSYHHFFPKIYLKERSLLVILLFQHNERSALPQLFSISNMQKLVVIAKSCWLKSQKFKIFQILLIHFASKKRPYRVYFRSKMIYSNQFLFFLFFFSVRINSPLFKIWIAKADTECWGLRVQSRIT